MQEEAQEYVQEQKLRDLVNQYSEFINFPIYLYTTKEVCWQHHAQDTCHCCYHCSPRSTSSPGEHALMAGSGGR
jgi:HSP90 family molecular chaperone